jgi:hypothetical protein
MSTDAPARPRRVTAAARWAVALLALALFLGGAALRLTDLEGNPPGFWQDEASTGIDAWLLWHTGRDRAGERWPLIARSFGDYPLALYRYLDAPLVGLLGPTIRNQRLVAALAGTLLLVAVALVLRRRLGDGAALAGLLVGALCPTWLHFSRYGSEAILLPALLTAGWACFERGRDPGRRGALWAGAACLGLSAYTYHAVKLFLPLWLPGFLALQAPLIRELAADRRARRHLFGPALLFAALVLPSAWVALSPGGLARGQTVLAWYQHSGVELLRVVANNYLSYFDPGMLFVRGGPAVAQSIPGLGMWNLIELPSVLAGLWAATRPGPQRRFFAFLLFWFALGPLPGGVTYETHNMGRAIGWLPAPQMLSAIGLWTLARALRARWAAPAAGLAGAGRRLGAALSLALLIAGWAVTARSVWRLTLVEYPDRTQRDWQFEISGAMRCALAHRADERLIVSPSFHLAEVFADFFFAELALGRARDEVWTLSERGVVAPGELYLFPAGRPIPQGREVCRVVNRRTDTPQAFVYAAPAPEALPADAGPAAGALPAVQPGPLPDGVRAVPLRPTPPLRLDQLPSETPRRAPGD